MTESEMMADLAQADASGDHELAQHIATQIKAARAQPEHGRFAEAAHKTASYLPMAGGIAGGVLGAGAGAATGPGAILLGALGAGALGGVGKAAQHGIDTMLGYEKAPGVLDATADTAKAGVGEALGAAGGGLMGEGIAAAAKPLGEPLRRLAVATTRRILRNTGGSIAASKPLAADAAQEVLDMGIVKPFGTSRGAAERLDVAREASGDTYGKIVKALEAKGITGPDADQLAQTLAAEASAVNANTLNPSVTSAYQTAADQVAGKPTASGRLGLTQAENLKRSAQDQAKSAYKQQQPGELARAHEDVASMMRQAVEDEIAKQTAKATHVPEVIRRVPTSSLSDIPAEAFSPERLARARTGLQNGNQQPIRITINEAGDRVLEDGAHRLTVARESGAPSIDVAFRDVRQAAPDREIQAIAAQFEPIKQQAGRLIEASNVSRAGMARAQNRNAISMADIAAFMGEQAHSGNPVKSAGAALLMHLARTRGPSTLAVGANAAANRLEDPASALLRQLGAGGGAAGGEKLIQLLEQLRQNRSESTSVP